jgi:hypothetical protein
MRSRSIYVEEMYICFIINYLIYRQPLNSLELYEHNPVNRVHV